MKLYHGTFAPSAEEIIKCGVIRPRADREGNWTESVKSNPDAVYMSDAYAPYFAYAARPEDHKIEQGKPVGAVFEIDTDLLGNLFVADEDAVEQADRALGGGILGDGLYMMSMIERTECVRDILPGLAERGYDHEWSLRVLGTCAYMGDVPMDAVTRIAWLYGHHWAFMFDPTITLVNYRLMGASYRHQTEQIFDGPDAEKGDAGDGILPFQGWPESLYDERKVEDLRIAEARLCA